MVTRHTMNGSRNVFENICNHGVKTNRRSSEYGTDQTVKFYKKSFSEMYLGFKFLKNVSI